MILVEQIKAARAMLNLSQKQLAEKSGISIATLNNIERGAQNDPKISTMRAIKTALESQGIEFTNENNGEMGVTLRPRRHGDEGALILMIDDSSSDRTLFKNWLGTTFGANYRIIEAENAKAGYEAFEAHRPDCIILDFKMYGMDGFQLLVEMKKDNAVLPPIIFVTGMHNGILEDSLKRHGVFSCLDKKELTPQALQETIKAALMKEQGHLKAIK